MNSETALFGPSLFFINNLGETGMTADPKESGQEVEAGEANPEATTPTDSDTSQVDVEALAEKLAPYMADIAKRETQSVKDKRFQRLENQVGDVADVLDKYEQLQKGGKTPEEAKERLELDARLEALEQQLGQSPSDEPAGKPETPKVSVETQAILKELGLDEKSAEVTKILRESDDIAQQLGAFVALTKTQTPTEPNPAAVQPSAGGASVNQSADAIADQLNVLYADPIKNKARIKALTAELDKVVAKQ